MKPITIFLLLICATHVQGQDSANLTAPLSFTGYLEVYYQYDFRRPENHTRPSFVFSYKRTNEIALNLGFLKGSYSNEKVRANLALMAGTYANANLTNEPGVLKNVFEASAGIRLSKSRNLWMDAGVLPSHIGFESAVGKDCWTLTRSILADNSPYYEAGLRSSYKTTNSQWYFAFLLLNGWQRMERVNGNNTPAFGTQVTFTPSQQLTVNSSTYVGNEFPDSISRWRYFHNFYTTWQISKQAGVCIGFDAGMQQRQKGSSALESWYGLALLLQYTLSQHWSLTGRWEYYKDTYGVIIPAVRSNPFAVQGASLDVDYVVSKNLMWRIEGKGLWSASPNLLIYNTSLRSTVAITTSLCFSLE